MTAGLSLRRRVSHCLTEKPTMIVDPSFSPLFRRAVHLFRDGNLLLRLWTGLLVASSLGDGRGLGAGEAEVVRRACGRGWGSACLVACAKSGHGMNGPERPMLHSFEASRALWSMDRSRAERGLGPHAEALGEGAKENQNVKEDMLRLKGGGIRKLIGLRGERRRQKQAAEAEKLGINQVKLPPRYRKPHAMRWEKFGGPPKDFKEYARRMGRDKPEWKLAELRLRAKNDPAPWTRWRGWNMTAEGYWDLEKQELVSGASHSEEEVHSDDKVEEKKSVWEQHRSTELAPEERLDDETSLRKVNDGKGNIDFKGVEDVPANITDINEALRWMDTHMESDHRYVTAEDLMEQQRETETERADELLRATVDHILKSSNISEAAEAGVLLPEDGTVEVADEDVDDFGTQFRKVLRLNPKNADALSAYGIYLMEMLGDAEGAEEMYKRALASEPNNTYALCNYAVLLRDCARDVKGARTLLERAMQANRRDRWVQLVAAQREWKEVVSVRAGHARMGHASSAKGAEGEGVGVHAGRREPLRSENDPFGSHKNRYGADGDRAGVRADGSSDVEASGANIGAEEAEEKLAHLLSDRRDKDTRAGKGKKKKPTPEGPEPPPPAQRAPLPSEYFSERGRQRPTHKPIPEKSGVRMEGTGVYRNGVKVGRRIEPEALKPEDEEDEDQLRSARRPM